MGRESPTTKHATDDQPRAMPVLYKTHTCTLAPQQVRVFWTESTLSHALLLFLIGYFPNNKNDVIEIPRPSMPRPTMPRPNTLRDRFSAFNFHQVAFDFNFVLGSICSHAWFTARLGSARLEIERLDGTASSWIIHNTMRSECSHQDLRAN